MGELKQHQQQKVVWWRARNLIQKIILINGQLPLSLWWRLMDSLIVVIKRLLSPYNPQCLSNDQPASQSALKGSLRLNINPKRPQTRFIDCCFNINLFSGSFAGSPKRTHYTPTTFAAALPSVINWIWHINSHSGGANHWHWHWKISRWIFYIINLCVHNCTLHWATRGQITTLPLHLKSGGGTEENRRTLENHEVN